MESVAQRIIETTRNWLREFNAEALNLSQDSQPNKLDIESDSDFLTQ